MLATQRGHAQVVKTLIDGKANPNITDKVQCCLVVFASCVDHVLLMIVCVQITGWSALFFAAKEGNVEIARLLIGSGANVELKDKVRW